MDITVHKIPEGYKVVVTKTVPQSEEQVFATIEEAVAKVKELEAQPEA